MSACAHDSVLEEEELDPQHTVIITVPDKIMEEPDGELDSRASLSLSGSNMLLKWDIGDQIGVFNISESAENSENKQLWFKSTEGNVSRFASGSFVSSPDYYWIAYAPYACNKNATTANKTKIASYNNISLTYLGQKQCYNATPLGLSPNATNSGYSAKTEAMASKYLHEYGYLFSAPSTPEAEGTATHFVFSHLGSTVRFYTRLPEGCFGGEGKWGKLTSLTLVSKTSNIVTDVELSINKYDKDNPSQPPFTVNSTTPANNITLDLPGEDGKGINLPDHGYFIAYMEFYPVYFPVDTCFIYITAEVDGVKKYFRSKLLPALNIGAGHLYKWTISKYYDPIELTATIAPWEDISGGTINTGE